MVFMSTWENNLNFLTLATNSKSPMSITHEICFLSSHQKDICLLYCMKVTLKLSYKKKQEWRPVMKQFISWNLYYFGGLF